MQKLVKILIFGGLAVSVAYVAKFAIATNDYDHNGFKAALLDPIEKEVQVVEKVLRTDDVAQVVVNVVEEEEKDFTMINYSPNDVELSRKEFARYFVQLLGLKVMDTGLKVFEDVEEGDVYEDYIGTLHSLGLIDESESRFRPDSLITRGEALKILMDYHDVPFSKEISSESKIKDVASDDVLYFYVHTFYEDFEEHLNEDFEPYKPASIDFIKFLNNEFAKNI